MMQSSWRTHEQTHVSDHGDCEQPVHLDVIACSSEDDGSPVQNLKTTTLACGVDQRQHQPRPTEDGGSRTRTCEVSDLHTHLAALTGSGWDSEKFCEYPQEIVFRVNRGIATRIHSVRTPFKWRWRQTM